MKASTSIVLDIRKQKKDKTYPVKLRVTHNRQQRYYSTKYSLSKEEFEKSRSVKPRGDFKEISLELHAIEKKAVDIIENLSFFTWQIFDKQFLSTKTKRSTLSEAFQSYINQLKEQSRIGTAVSYECARRSLESFDGKLKFIDVTPEVLRKYEKWMLSNGNSITTVGIYLRNLRCLFNIMIADGLLNLEFYPFGKRKYEIPTANNVKKALTKSEIHSIFTYKANEDTNEAVCKDYWIFMYLCFGINVKDMCLLKYHNIKDDMIVFERAKTARTKRKVEPIRVPLTAQLKAIIEARGNEKRLDDNYIFPILKKGLSPERERRLIQQATHLINDHMKNVAKVLGINKLVTTYVARHSFATVLQRSGAATAFISEALGHGSMKTTQNYLAGFEDKTKMEAVKALTDFDEEARA